MVSASTPILNSGLFASWLAVAECGVAFVELIGIGTQELSYVLSLKLRWVNKKWERYLRVHVLFFRQQPFCILKKTPVARRSAEIPSTNKVA